PVVPEVHGVRNPVDAFLLDALQSKGLSFSPPVSKEKFIRRVTLDLTGRIPSADAVTAFLADTNPNKRDVLVDSLIGTPEFVDKWTMFFGDLFKVTGPATNINRYTGGRDAFYNYIKSSIAANKSYAQMATEMITANGDNFVDGQVNFIVGGTVPMGPRTGQDTMDGTAVVTSSMFLGINTVDCLLCHNGRGHLESVNLWGSQKTRFDAWGLSAFFARVQQTRTVLSQTPNYFKYTISERTAGEYTLNTNTGNRTDRVPTNGVSNVPPKYLWTGATPNAGESRRVALARLITADKQFARAAVNYVWEKIMVEALVSPSNTFDPARLDPKATLPNGWSLQPANCELLEGLADDFIKNNFNLRTLIGTIVKANAYQLSSEYPDSWNLSMVPYYARKYVRRLDAEEIHDAIMKATSIGATYQMRDTLGNNTFTVNWAMQLPDTLEPQRTNGAVAAFLNSFVRGDRDVKPRSLEPSIMQSLNLMNNNFVMTRIHNANAGSTVSRLLADANRSSQDIITQLYLNTLSRNPTSEEINALLPQFGTLGRRQAAEAIQWALLNKMDFIFNY
ncbi:MAG TPA: DUF1549 domain-containing protein, partial [Blastocatellia bacterium]|nr:DUF1549 domain-containing protein [Blastocatellia bacterium]